jgi:hypothetical protein
MIAFTGISKLIKAEDQFSHFDYENDQLLV